MREDREDKMLRMRNEDKTEIGDPKMEAARGTGEAEIDLINLIEARALLVRLQGYLFEQKCQLCLVRPLYLQNWLTI